MVIRRDPALNAFAITFADRPEPANHREDAKLKHR